MKEEEELELESNNINKKFNFRKTDWKKYSKILDELIEEEIPSDRNLSKQEISEYLHKFDDLILEAMEKAIPKIQDRNSVDSYINGKIKKMQKEKNKIPKYITREEDGQELMTTT